MPPRRPARRAAARLSRDVLVLGRAAQADDDIVLQASILHEEGVRIRTCRCSTSSGSASSRSPSSSVCRCLFDIGELHTAGYARVKRLFDIAFALCGCVALVLVTPFVLIGDLVANRGPLIFRQPRTGRNGGTFEMLKFRTMRERAEDHASRLDGGGRRTRSPVRTDAPTHAPRRAAAGRQHPAR